MLKGNNMLAIFSLQFPFFSGLLGRPFTTAETIFVAQKYCRNVRSNDAAMNTDIMLLITIVPPEYANMQAVTR